MANLKNASGYPKCPAHPNNPDYEPMYFVEGDKLQLACGKCFPAIGVQGKEVAPIKRAVFCGKAFTAARAAFVKSVQARNGDND